ncbi:MAG: DNA/RNA non-specific endonuclease [Eggerthellaceae bacterium]
MLKAEQKEQNGLLNAGPLRALWAIAASFALALSVLSGCSGDLSQSETGTIDHAATEVVQVSDVPEYEGDPYVKVNDNEPSFSQDDLQADPGTEEYGDLDDLGRCTETFAVVGEETMPTEKRGDISSVYPTGWEQNFYSFVDQRAVYNRCHLIGYQLTAENANEENLITGTRYMNVQGMEPFESRVAKYVKATDNHVVYRVTPIFEGDNLVASGVQMEAQSVEDDGAGICFNVYCYNVQPGVEIDYATGENWSLKNQGSEVNAEGEYILNVKSKKFHLPDCQGAESMSAANRQEYEGPRQDLIDQGYEPCGICNP